MIINPRKTKTPPKTRLEIHRKYVDSKSLVNVRIKSDSRDRITECGELLGLTIPAAVELATELLELYIKPAASELAAELLELYVQQTEEIA